VDEWVVNESQPSFKIAKTNLRTTVSGNQKPTIL